MHIKTAQMKYGTAFCHNQVHSIAYYPNCLKAILAVVLYFTHNIEMHYVICIVIGLKSCSERISGIF